MREEEEQERQAARQLARERVLRDFERLQSGAGASTVSNSATTSSTVESVAADRGTKRKFALDQDEVTRLQDEQEEKALKEIEREQAEKRKAKLPNFWLVCRFQSPTRHTSADQSEPFTAKSDTRSRTNEDF